ncbi:MAG: sulfate transporter CysZ [Magnetococcales bacterium]|nr:sulfate transporter CysZ [Magnetococcales bacterium]
MKTISPFHGPLYLARGLRLLTRPELRPFVILPLLTSSVIFAYGTWVILERLKAWTASVTAWLPSWLHFMEWLVMPLFFTVAGAMLFWCFGMIANVLGAPFNALLAQKVEELLLAQEPVPPPARQVAILKTIVPTLRSEINKILYFLLRAIPLLLLFLVPVVNIAAPILWLLFTCWMTAFQYLDFPMGNHDWDDKRILAALREQRLLSLGFGASVLLMTSIPVVNFLAMPAAVAGATAIWAERMRQ